MSVGFNNNVNYTYDSAANVQPRHYKSRDGLKVAAVPAGMAIASGLTSGITYGVVKKKIAAGETVSADLMKYFNDMKASGGLKSILLGGAIAIGGNLLCGAIVDAVRNKKSKEFADKLELTGEYDRENAGISQNNHIYYKSNIGTKVGAALGAIWCGGLLLAERYSSKINITKHAGNNRFTKALAVISAIATGAIGGAIMGRITDHFANKKAGETV